MKNIIFSFLFLILSTQLIYSKEVRTRYGFYIDLPENYTSLSANMDEILKGDKNNELAINKEYFNEIMAGSSKSDLNIEYFFPKKKYNPEFNNINLTMMDGNVRDFLEYTMEEICSEVKVMVRSLYNKNVKEYRCEMNPKKIKKKN